MIYKLLSTRVYRSYYGGKNIDYVTGVENPDVTRFPEDWLASVVTAFNPDRPIENEGLSKTTEGRFLKDIIEEKKEEMIGKRENMSLLFKLLDSNERLVIQVHPTKEFAKKHFNSQYGKTECWYMLNDGGYVYIGFKPGVSKEQMKGLFEKQDTDGMLETMHRFDVKKGDFIYVAGGVPHAIGEGCFMAELQEPTDLMVISEDVILIEKSTPEEIAKILNAEIGASRGLVDMNKAIYDKQIGLTGKAVSPKIYIAIGISGALHHTCGIEGAETVIAVNPDKDARIFEYADFGIVEEF